MMLNRFSSTGAACALVAMLASALPASSAPPTSSKTAKAAVAAPVPNGEKLLADIRKVFRSHRPPPPYVTYTLTRTQQTEQGYPDYANIYTEHIWCRSSDRAALERKVYRDDYRGPLTFDRPAFNEARDPGPPTADLF